jgi:DDE superfamily endonuclease
MITTWYLHSHLTWDWLCHSCIRSYFQPHGAFPEVGAYAFLGGIHAGSLEALRVARPEAVDLERIKPWQHEHWLFPKDPQFAEKAGPILDLHAGMWEGKSLGPTDYVLSMDEKTSIQARGRRHEETPPQPKQTRRVEAEYKRNGALQYLAAWDVHRGIVLGRCEKKTGIKPFGLLVDQVLEQAPYKDATQLFFIVDNGSSHRGQASVERMLRRDKRIVLVHTPIHASWLNQVEIYFSIIQRKVLTPNDFAKLEAIRVRLALYEELSNRTPKPFAWKFTRQDMLNWLKRASPHFLAAPAA